MMNSSSVFTAENVLKNYDDFSINVHHLDLKEGEFVGLVGENGAGKTSLIKLLLGVSRPDSGKVITQTGKNIGVTFDFPCFPQSLTAKQLQLIFKNIYDSWSDEVFFKLLEQFELPLNKKVEDFSRGMKAKLDIVCMLSHSPDMLILDETTSNLDPLARREIHSVIKKYSDNKNAAVLFSSHIVGELEEICHRILFMDKGRIAYDIYVNELDNNYFITKHSDKKSFPKTALSYVNEGGIYLALNYTKDEELLLENEKILGVEAETIMLHIKKGVWL